MSDSVLRIYDPAMCCDTGVCGPEVDPGLARFAADVEWLKQQGVSVERYNASREPGAFVSNLVVRRALQEEGSKSLPLVLWGEETVATGGYPDRKTLGHIVGLPSAVASGGEV